MFRISVISNVAHREDFKNVTFNTLSFFFCLMQLDERVLSNCDVTGLVKNALSSAYAPFCLARASHAHVITVAVVQSNGDLFSSKIEQSILIDNA